MLNENEPFEVKNPSINENSFTQQIDLSTIAGKGFNIRAAACAIDIVIIIIFSILLIYAAGFLMGYIFPRFGLWFDESHNQSIIELDLLRGNILALLYFSFFEWLYGATPGKIILRMRVVRVDGQPLGWWPTIVRGVFRLVDGFIFGVPAGFYMIDSAHHQRIGDKYARTMVVSKKEAVSLGDRKPLWGFFLAAEFSLVLFLACGFWFIHDRMDVVSPSTITTASEINIISSDLTDNYDLAYEMGGVGYPEDNIIDMNERQYQRSDYQITSTIVIYSFVPTDSYEVIMETVIDDAKQNPENEVVTFAPAHELSIGDRAGIARFFHFSTNEEGYMLFVVRKNIFFRLVGYGDQKYNDPNELIKLAEAIVSRIQ